MSCFLFVIYMYEISPPFFPKIPIYFQSLSLVFLETRHNLHHHRHHHHDDHTELFLLINGFGLQHKDSEEAH